MTIVRNTPIRNCVGSVLNVEQIILLYSRVSTIEKDARKYTFWLRPARRVLPEKCRLHYDHTVVP